ncbi:MAG: hypothetical protein LBQ86_01335 [Holophagales bacterium]|jgi:hypothetical protein|nr:hypothetical protein [Holophagales bacterium]
MANMKDLQQFFDAAVEKALSLVPCPIPIVMEAMPDDVEDVCIHRKRYDEQLGRDIVAAFVFNKEAVKECFAAKEGQSFLTSIILHDMAHVFFDAHDVEIYMGNGTVISAFVPNKGS